MEANLIWVVRLLVFNECQLSVNLIAWRNDGQELKTCRWTCKVINGKLIHDGS